MQGSAAATEREARRRLPSLLANLLDEPVVHVDPPHSDDAPQVDLIASDESGRRWVIEIKNSSRPGQVARAAEQLLPYADEGVIPVLVVPFMSRAGAETADRVRLNHGPESPVSAGATRAPGLSGPDRPQRGVLRGRPALLDGRVGCLVHDQVCRPL